MKRGGEISSVAYFAAPDKRTTEIPNRIVDCWDVKIEDRVERKAIFGAVLDLRLKDRIIQFRDRRPTVKSSR